MEQELKNQEISELRKEIFLLKKDKERIEAALQQKIRDLEKLTNELRVSRTALLNILEEVEEARALAEVERDKTFAIIENFPEGVLFFDKKNKLASANPKIGEIFKISPQVLVGKEISELNEFPSLHPLIKILNQGGIKGLFKREIKIRENLILEASVIRVRKGEEKIGILVIIRNITREKMVEKLKTEFVSIAAHQLRTPLSAIKWTLRMILDGDIGKISKEQRDFLEKTYKSNERMIRLINDLLNITRIEEGRFLYNFKTENIIKIIETVIAPLREIAGRRGINLVFERPAAAIPAVKGDSEKLSLALQNLIDNAIHYTDSGGEVRISVENLKEKKEVRVAVKDTGIGIPKEQQNRVFSRFFRGANAIRHETEGTGLGLYIAKNVIESHRGRIWFESKENKGSTFYFTLPTG